MQGDANYGEPTHKWAIAYTLKSENVGAHTHQHMHTKKERAWSNNILSPHKIYLEGVELEGEALG